MLENSENRLQRILGNRSIHPTTVTTSQSQLEPRGNVSNATSTAKEDDSNKKNLVIDTEESEHTTGRDRVLSAAKDVEDQTCERISTKENISESQDTETDGNRYLDNDFKTEPEVTTARSQNTSDSTSAVNNTPDNESSSAKSGIWTRAVFNVALAFVLVSRWTYVNLEVLLSTNEEQGRTDDSHDEVLVQSEVRTFKNEDIMNTSSSYHTQNPPVSTQKLHSYIINYIETPFTVSDWLLFMQENDQVTSEAYLAIIIP